MADETRLPDGDTPAVGAAFRKRVALYCLLTDLAVAAAALLRETDLGDNVASLLTWIVVGNVLVIAGVVGAKAVESVFALRTGGAGGAGK